jgi:hypothetical protein
MRKIFGLAPALLVATGVALAACKPAPPFKEYAYPAWGFVARFWAPPEPVEAPSGPGKPHSLLLESKQAGRDFVVSVMEGVRPDVTIDEIGPDYARQAAKALGVELGPETYTSTGQGVLGREYALTKNGKPYATMRAFLANGRFYEIAAQSVLGPDDPAVKGFLDTFRITTAPPAAPPPPANAAPANAAAANAIP